MSLLFLPWIGPHYEQGLDGVKVLVLGESHYVDQPREDLGGLTREVVAHFGLQPGVRHPFFTKVAKTLLDRDDLPDDVRAAFWRRVAYYNYVQEPVGTAARMRPAPASWARSADAFHQVLADLRPDVVVVLGKALWQHLPTGGDRPGHVARLVNTNHPSGRGFRYDVERPKLAAALAAARAANV